jgi:DNA polymerase-4
MRKVIHVDMDAFYAAVEERDDPTLRGRPIAVGGGSPRGVVMTASYAARRFGVRSAMPGARALQLCPELVFVRPRFDAYKSASRDIQAIFHRFTDLVEPLSLDEAYLDVSDPKGGPMPAARIARSIKDAILSETGLTASAGVSTNKFLAKLASELEKPDGLCVIRPEQSLAILARLPIDRFHGVGPATARRLRAAGIALGGDLQALAEAEAVRRLGRQGRHFWQLAHGIDDRPVRPERERKSLSVETTFATDIVATDALERALDQLAAELAHRLTRSGFGAAAVTLKIKYRDFRLTTRQTTLSSPPRGAAALASAARALLRRAPLTGPVRLLGLGVGGPADKAQQLALPLGGGESDRPAQPDDDRKPSGQG